MARPRIQRNLPRLRPLGQQPLNLPPPRSVHHPIILRCCNGRRPRNGGNLPVLQQTRMRREGRIAALSGADEAEGIPPAEAVPGEADLLDAERGAQVVDCLGDDGVRHVGAVLGEERGGVEARDVDVAGGVLAEEEVRRDG